MDENLGVRQTILKELDDLIDYQMDNQRILDDYVLEILKRLSLSTNKEILIVTNDKNRVQWVNIGDAVNVGISDDDMLYHVKSLNRYRVIHTHPNGNPHLSEEDFSAAKAESLQCIIAIGIKEGQDSRFAMGVPLVRNDEIIYKEVVFDSLKELNHFPLDELVAEANAFIKIDPNRVFDDEDQVERVLLLGVDVGKRQGIDLDESMKELKQLVLTAGGQVIETMTQNRPQIDPAFYVGKGKIQEVVRAVQNSGINLIVSNDELNARQIANIERASGVKTLDRTSVILDIFAKHAKTREGKLQVELAQQKYRMSHLKGLGITMSQTGGGIGTRGPGEKKLETDRRHIRQQIEELEEKTKQIQKSNAITASQRQKNNIKTVSLIGYTNSGKSTLFNRLTKSQVSTQDGLFITLDSTLRKVDDEKKDYLISDTVGFIDKLPHELVNAFKTTLKEVETAELLLHVVDLSNPNYKDHIQVVNDVLKELNVDEKKMILVYNKIDQLSDDDQLLLQESIEKETDSVMISAKDGQGIKDLLTTIEGALLGMRKEQRLLIPYEDASSLALLHELNVVLDIAYQELGTQVIIEIREDFPSHLFEKYYSDEEV